MAFRNRFCRIVDERRGDFGNGSKVSHGDSEVVQQQPHRQEIDIVVVVELVVARAQCLRETGNTVRGHIADMERDWVGAARAGGRPWDPVLREDLLDLAKPR